MTLRDRCKAFNDKAAMDAIMRTGDPVQNLMTFVTDEVNRSQRDALCNGQSIMKMRVTTLIARRKRDASFDDSIVGAQEHNANEENILREIAALTLPSPSDPKFGILEAIRKELDG